MGIRSMLFGRESARIDRGRECLARGDHYGALQQVAGLEHRDVTDIRTHALQGVRASIARRIGADDYRRLLSDVGRCRRARLELGWSDGVREEEDLCVRIVRDHVDRLLPAGDTERHAQANVASAQAAVRQLAGICPGNPDAIALQRRVRRIVLAKLSARADDALARQDFTDLQRLLTRARLTDEDLEDAPTLREARQALSEQGGAVAPPVVSAAAQPRSIPLQRQPISSPRNRVFLLEARVQGITVRRLFVYQSVRILVGRASDCPHVKIPLAGRSFPAHLGEFTFAESALYYDPFPGRRVQTTLSRRGVNIGPLAAGAALDLWGDHRKARLNVTRDAPGLVALQVDGLRLAYPNTSRLDEADGEVYYPNLDDLDDITLIDSHSRRELTIGPGADLPVDELGEILTLQLDESMTLSGPGVTFGVAGVETVAVDRPICKSITVNTPAAAADLRLTDLGGHSSPDPFGT